MSDKNEADLRAASPDDLKEMGLPAAFTLDELKGFLSEDEIKALQDGDDPLLHDDAGDHEAEATSDEDASDADAEGDDTDEDGDDEANDASDDAADDADAVADDTNVEDADAVDDGEAVTSFIEAKADGAEPVRPSIDVSAARSVVDGAKAARQELTAKFNDGELSEAEFDEQLEALTDKIADARAEIRDAERQTTAQAKDYETAWFAKTGAFMEANPAFANNEPVAGLGGHSRLQLFDAALRRVTGDPGYASLSMSEKINTAARLATGFYKQETGEEMLGGKPTAKVTTGKTNEQANKAPAKPDKAADKRPDPGKRPDPVRTLGGVTTASSMETDDGRFAAIDRAGGVMAEVEFSRMSQAEKDAYLRGA